MQKLVATDDEAEELERALFGARGGGRREGGEQKLIVMVARESVTIEAL
jgi:hypothetical protein